ncbi:hypothetical protein FKM82_002127, partial [Ascaphus truei]
GHPGTPRRPLDHRLLGTRPGGRGIPAGGRRGYHRWRKGGKEIRFPIEGSGEWKGGELLRQSVWTAALSFQESISTVSDQEHMDPKRCFKLVRVVIKKYNNIRCLTAEVCDANF